MIIVTGTKRSGTSMWMQILIAAGYPAFGEAFPRSWGETIRDANPSGFYESTLRHGIYYRTNPHPRTGDYFFPEQVERHVVKVFIPGLVRSDRAYIGRVVATIRPFREYGSSLARLYKMEDDRAREKRPDFEPPTRMPPTLEWWSENFALVRDIATRRYPVHVQTYDGLLERPAEVIKDTLEWLGGDADVAKATAAVEPKNRTQRDVSGIGEELEPGHAKIFDDLYETIGERKGLSRAFIQALNETNVALLPQIHEAQREVAEAVAKRRAAAVDQPPAPVEVDRMDPGA